ncbi:MAG: hypothetical protein J6T96_12965 [Bacteroidales bacterium]|nr:hypothetical protein [Bacteroidales bacterium]
MFALLIIVIIAIIVGQAVIFGRLKAKINAFKEVFKHPYDKAEFNTITYDSKANGIFKVIVTCINSYIQNNGNRANDYHLMQDIVERNCDSKEEEIQSQIPTTLYLGLIGTMLGIIIGISELFSGGGLSELLAGTVQTNAIENMLKGVAVAMLASAAGITLTTILTFIFKSAKAKNADDKNLFLSWIQANLLPAMSSDVNTALDKMSEALSKFNDQFADNTQKLNSTLSLVAKTSEDQALLYDAISNLEIGEMAKANVKVYKALKDSAEQIDHLADVLRASRDYVDEVRTLNENLDKSERRTKMFEEMGDFFRTEINAIETRKQMILNSIEESNEKFNGEFNKFVGKYEDKADKVVEDLSNKFESQNAELTKLAAKQEDIIKGSDFSSMPSKMSKLENTVNSLSHKLETTEKNISKEIADINVSVSLPDKNSTNTVNKDRISVIVGIISIIVLGIVSIMGGVVLSSGAMTTIGILTVLGCVSVLVSKRFLK